MNFLLVNMRGFVCCVGLLLALVSVQGQTDLSLADAVALALKNNYDIRISKMDVDIAQKQPPRRNSGLIALPQFQRQQFFFQKWKSCCLYFQ